MAEPATERAQTPWVSLPLIVPALIERGRQRRSSREAIVSRDRGSRARCSSKSARAVCAPLLTQWAWKREWSMLPVEQAPVPVHGDARVRGTKSAPEQCLVGGEHRAGERLLERVDHSYRAEAVAADDDCVGGIRRWARIHS